MNAINPFSVLLAVVNVAPVPWPDSAQTSRASPNFSTKFKPNGTKHVLLTTDSPDSNLAFHINEDLSGKDKTVYPSLGQSGGTLSPVDNDNLYVAGVQNATAPFTITLTALPN